MGLQIGDILPRKEVTFEELKNQINLTNEMSAIANDKASNLIFVLE